MKIEEMFGDSFSQKRTVWKKRGNHIERCEVDALKMAKNAALDTKLEMDDKK